MFDFVNTKEVASAGRNNQKVFSICTLMTCKKEYEQMLKSFLAAGFNNENSEFLYIDNSISNKLDAYQAIKRFISISNSKYIIICHQDVILEFEGIHKIYSLIDELEQLDPNWAILGNTGYKSFVEPAMRISDPIGDDQKLGELPAKVESLDENFILIKAKACLSISNNLTGFHLCATDMCIIAKMLGYSAYVVDFHLKHKSQGDLGLNFKLSKLRFIDKYREVLSNRFIRTPCTKMYLSGSRVLNSIMNRKYVYSVKKRIAHAKNKLR